MAFQYRTERNKKLYRHHRALRWHVSTGAALLVVLFIFTVWLRPLRMGDDGMAPTLKKDSAVLYDALIKYIKMPERTDIITFREADGTIRVRRIVALAGESVCGQGKQLRLNENYVLEEPYTEGDTADFSVFTVPEGCVFALPDNRSLFNGDNAQDYIVELGRIRGIVHLGILPEIQIYL